MSKAPICEFPEPSIQERPRNTTKEQAALQLGLHPVLARVLAARPLSENPLLDILTPSLHQLSSPVAMADIQRAADRLTQALINQECIGIVTDHDCDGQTSHAVLFEALTGHFRHPRMLVRSYIGHRLQEGYGLSQALAERICQDQPTPTLLITADHGSTDEPRIAWLAERGIEVIVTDHHQLPVTGPPQSAFACVNPTRPDCPYPDPLIAGCMVAWLLMTMTKQALKKAQYELPDLSLARLLDFVAVGTVADCVSMARSHNNRIVVTYGLMRIADFQRPCWQALQPLLSVPLKGEDLGFKIGPLLNSDGRLASALRAVSFLLAESLAEAQEWVKVLTEQNIQRKKIQQTITEQSMTYAWEQVNACKSSISIYLPNGHSGVHGISASRLKDGFGRPVAIAAPKLTQPELITGSIRGVSGLDVKQALQTMALQTPDLFVAYGGHTAAAGFTMAQEKWESFVMGFEAAVQEQLSTTPLGPVILTDGPIPDNIAKAVPLLEKLEPFGREFDPPTFECQGRIIHLLPVGADGCHLKLRIEVNHTILPAIWFFVRKAVTEDLPVAVDDRVKLVVRLQQQTFRRQTRIEAQILFCQRLP